MSVDPGTVGLVLARRYCEADRLHHPGCPGELTGANRNDFSIHHRYTRERARREHVDAFTVDQPGNLMLVYNAGPLGAGGCHGRIHSYRREAHRLGYLLTEPPPLPVVSFDPATDPPITLVVYGPEPF